MGSLIFRRARLRAAPTLIALTCVVALLCPIGASAQVLTLQDALRRAADVDPALPAADARIEAATAGVRQADTRPNPTLGFELENFVGTGPFGFFNESQTTLSYSQRYERGNKREARTSLARAGVRTAEIEKQVYAVEFFERVETAFVEAVAAEAAVSLSAERLEAAERLQAETERRVQAAREPAFAGARVTALVAEARIGLVHAEASARTATLNLAAYWSESADIPLDMAWFENAPANPGIALNEETVDLALISAERDVAGARITFEQAQAVQDPTFSGGLRHFALGGDVAVVAGVALPLPLYNDNSGNISRAMAERSAANQEYAALRRNLQREVTTLQARVAAHAEEAEALRTSAIPQTEEALGMIREGFDRGAFEYIDIIDAERAVNDARTQRLEILREYHLDIARLNRLAGRHLSAVNLGEAR
jgi:cobalt-zinc-cadmium efflux system outer membrane protein